MTMKMMKNKKTKRKRTQIKMKKTLMTSTEEWNLLRCLIIINTSCFMIINQNSIKFMKLKKLKVAMSINSY
jgi:hypothetical protein